MAFCYRTKPELERKLRLLQNLVGKADLMKFYDVPYPPVTKPLSPLDWSIIKNLWGDARRPLSDVAEEIGVSARTVKRRFDRMARDGGFYIIPIVDPANVPGLILPQFVFEFKEGAEPAILNMICKTLQDRLVCIDGCFGVGSPCFSVGLYANTIGEVEELRRRVATVEGIRRVQVLVLASSVEKFDWIYETIEQKAVSVPSANPQ